MSFLHYLLAFPKDTSFNDLFQRHQIAQAKNERNK